MKRNRAHSALSSLLLAFIVSVSYGAACDGSSTSEPDPALDRIDITPSPLVQVRSGGTVQFTATAFDKAGNAVAPQPSFSWSSGNPVAVVSPSTSGSVMATVTSCSSAGCGTCSRITATAGGIVGETHVALEGTIGQYPCPPE